MDILTIAVQKGGSGKTTTAAVLAQAAAHKNKKVLAIDLDPQGNLTLALGGDALSGGNSYNLLTGGNAAAQVQHTEQGIDVIPASWDLSTISSSTGSARRLQAAIQPLTGSYDLIVIDTPPTAGELQYNALQAATGLVIPLQADIYNLQALYQIIDTAKQIQYSNQKLIIKGFLLTQHTDRSTISRQMGQTITEQAAAAGVPFLGSVRAAIAVKEAAAMQQSLYKYAPNSKPAADYMAIYEKL